MAPEIDKQRGLASTQDQRYSRAQLDAANDMWVYFKRLAGEKADANAAYEKQIARLKKDAAKDKADTSAAYEKRIALLKKDAAKKQAEADAAYEKRIARLKKNTKSLKSGLQAVSKDLDVLLTHADVIEFKLMRMLSSRTWRMMEPVRFVGRWVRAIIFRRQPVREPLPRRPELSAATRGAKQDNAK